MKKTFTSAALLLLGMSLTQAQVTETVSTSANYADQVWYSLENGEVGRELKDEWDIAFEVPGSTASILVNIQKGMSVWRTGLTTADWATLTDLSDESAWTSVQNADTSWHMGALNNQNLSPSAFDLGWGTYNVTTHQIQGSRLFVIELLNGDRKKLKINSLIGGVYNFTYANGDGSDEVTATITKSDYTGKRFAYYSIENDTELDREPLSVNWDITFHKYMRLTPSVYGVTGVWSNPSAKVSVARQVDVDNVEWGNYVWDTKHNTIGWDWKEFNMGTFTYDIEDSLVFFIKDVPGDIWKVIFTGFSGASNGDYIFTKEKISSVSVDDQKYVLNLNVFPNPSDGQDLQLVVDLPNAVQGTLSITDLSGRVVYTAPFNRTAGFFTEKLALPSMNAGIYLLRIDAGQVQGLQKIVIR